MSSELKLTVGYCHSVFSVSPVNNVHYIKGLIERKTSWGSLQELETFFLFNGRENKIAGMANN